MKLNKYVEKVGVTRNPCFGYPLMNFEDNMELKSISILNKCLIGEPNI
jgi:hypothetical protein